MTPERIFVLILLFGLFLGLFLRRKSKPPAEELDVFMDLEAIANRFKMVALKAIKCGGNRKEENSFLVYKENSPYGYGYEISVKFRNGGDKGKGLPFLVVHLDQEEINVLSKMPRKPFYEKRFNPNNKEEVGAAISLVNELVAQFDPSLV